MTKKYFFFFVSFCVFIDIDYATSLETNLFSELANAHFCMYLLHVSFMQCIFHCYIDHKGLQGFIAYQVL